MLLKRLPKSVYGRATVVMILLASMQAHASTTTYNSVAKFSGAVGSSITDNYQSPGYTFLQTDAQMNAVFGQTTYTTTGFADHDVVSQITGTTTNAYCGGCNGSFTLGFLQTSLSLSAGVYGVGFNFRNSGVPSYDAFVTFGDGSTENYALPGTAVDFSSFFGITSDLLIASIALGLADGATTQNGYFALTNLTVATVGTTPLPAALPLFATGLGALGLLGWRKKRKAQAVA